MCADTVGTVPNHHLPFLGNSIVVLVFAMEAKHSERLLRFNVYCICIAMADFMALLVNSVLDDFLGRGLSHLTNGAAKYKLDTYSQSACKVSS